MGSLNLGVIGWTALASETNVDPLGQQPQMQAGRKWRWRGIIVKDRSVIERDAAWQAAGQEGTPQHELIGFQRRIGRIETGVAFDLDTADDINNADQRDLANSGNVHAALGIQFPFIM